MPLNLRHKWNGGLTDPILQCMTDICIHSKLWLQMWLSEPSKIVKGSIDCSVLFCNVTRVLTLSVTLDTWCIMSVAQTRKWLQKIWQVCLWNIILDHSTRCSIFTGGWRHLSFKVLCLFVCMLVCLLVCLAFNSNSNTLK